MPTRKIRDLDPQEKCLNRDHEPPRNMVYSEGVYEHTCPGCGKVTVFTVRTHSWMSRGIPLWPTGVGGKQTDGY
jgi:transposase